MGKHKKKRKPSYQNQQPCWTCKNCINGCSWALFLKPVEGWNAIPTTILGYNGNKLPSYKILYCPEYEEQ